MALQPQGEVTQLLAAIRAGDAKAQERLFDLLYQELRELAADLMCRERSDHILQPSALVNEAVLRLLEDDVLAKAPNRRYFFDTVTKVMRQVLVDYARSRSARKRGGDWQRASLENVVVYSEDGSFDVCVLDQLLKDLAAVNERQSQVVGLRVFAGLTWKDVAQQLNVSESTVRADFGFARAWLRARLEGEIDDTPTP